MTKGGQRRVRLVAVVALVLIGGWLAYYVGVRVRAAGWHRAAREAVDRHDFDAAADALGHYLFLRPTDAEARLLAAQTARRLGDLVAAQAGLDAAERAGAPADEVDTERMLLRTEMGDPRGIGTLMSVCQSRPGSPEAALALEALVEGGIRSSNLAGARWAIDLWLRHRPAPLDQVRGLLWRGRIHELTQDPQGLADFQKAVELAPDHFVARLRLADTLVRVDPAAAVPHLEWLRQQRPDDPEVRFQAARLHRNLARPEEAARLLDGLLAASPDRVPFLVERGRVALDLHQPGDAERWLLHAQALAPEQRDVNLALADCLRQAGRLDEAKRFQDKVAEIDARLEKILQAMTQQNKGG